MFFPSVRRGQTSELAMVDVVEGEIIEDSTDLATTASTAVSRHSYVLRETRDEIIVRFIPPGVRLEVHHGGARVLVLGNVYEGGSAFAYGGSARIDVMGSVASKAELFAEGGGAHVLVVGSVSPNARISAQGGGARVELMSNTTSRSAVFGGGAEVLYFG